MSQQARAYLNSMGIQPAVDVRGMDLSRYQLNSLEDFRALESAAYDESQRLGYPGQLSRAVEAAYMRGLDQTLPSLEAAPGMSRSIEDLAGDAAMAQADSARYFVRESMDQRIAGASLRGVPFTDWPADQLRDELSAMMVDVSPSNQRVLLETIAAIDNSPLTSFHSISYESTEVDNTVWVNTDNEDAMADPYTAWRQGNVDGNSQVGLPYIRPSVDDSALWSGITNWNGTGGTYEVASDHHLQATMAQQQSNDFNQGDAGSSNTFVD
jgi:hypothetical protein